MFEYGFQTPLSTASDTKNASLFDQGSQLYSTDGLQFGSISWQDNNLHVDTLWNINLVKDLTNRARTAYTASLSLIGTDGTPQVLENLVEKNAARINASKIKIPDRVNFEVNAAILEQLHQGARLVVGITQKGFQQRQGRDANFAYGSSLDITDAITGGTPSSTPSLLHDPITNAYAATRQANGSDRRLIGTEQYLDGCDFSNQDLSGIDFAKTNEGKVVRVAGVNFRNSILRNTTWGYTTDDGSYSYSQWWSKFTEPEPRANFSYADLGGSKLFLNTRAEEKGYGVEFLNSEYGKVRGQRTRPDYPIMDHAKVYDVDLHTIWPNPQDSPSTLLNPPHRATFIRLKNESGRQVSLANIVTNVFNPWSTLMKPGEAIELTGTTAYYSGDDISFEVASVGRVVADNPPFKSTYVDINGQRFTDGSNTISIGDTRMRVTYQGDGGPKYNEQKVWELAFY